MLETRKKPENGKETGEWERNRKTGKKLERGKEIGKHTSVTLAIRVSAISLRTGADRVVGPGVAARLGGARILVDARVNALLVDAGLVLGALGVAGALGARLDWKL